MPRNEYPLLTTPRTLARAPSAHELPAPRSDDAVGVPPRATPLPARWAPAPTPPHRPFGAPDGPVGSPVSPGMTGCPAVAAGQFGGPDSAARQFGGRRTATGASSPSSFCSASGRSPASPTACGRGTSPRTRPTRSATTSQDILDTIPRSAIAGLHDPGDRRAGGRCPGDHGPADHDPRDHGPAGDHPRPVVPQVTIPDVTLPPGRDAAAGRDAAGRASRCRPASRSLPASRCRRASRSPRGDDPGRRATRLSRRCSCSTAPTRSRWSTPSSVRSSGEPTRFARIMRVPRLRLRHGAGSSAAVPRRRVPLAQRRRRSVGTGRDRRSAATSSRHCSTAPRSTGRSSPTIAAGHRATPTSRSGTVTHVIVERSALVEGTP